MRIDSQTAAKAGLIGAGIGLVVALLRRVPFLGCVVGPLAWVVVVGTGALYVHYAATATRAVEVSEGALGGAVAGGIAGAAQSTVTGILALTFGPVRTAVALLGQGQPGAAALSTGMTFLRVIGGIVLGTVIGAALGALGGVIYAAVRKS